MTIPFEIEARAEVKVTLYDMLGREVAVLADGYAESGRHRAVLETDGLPAGVYLIRGTVAGPRGSVQAFTERITLVK